MNYKAKIFILFMSIFMFSCTANCDEFASIYKERECILKIHTKSLDIRSFYVGENPYTHKACDCRDSYHSFLTYRKYLDIGDTLVKRKGDLFLTIHKKDTILTFDFVCHGKNYNQF